MNDEWHVVATNLGGLTLSQAEARIREMIEALQEEELATADVASVARLRTEHVRLREQAIQNWRIMFVLQNAQNETGRLN